MQDIHRPPPPAGEADPHRWRTLAIVFAGAFLVIMDTTIVNVAIPAIRDDLGASTTAIEWVIVGYALAFGLFLALGGQLGDRNGRRRLFCAGLAVFTTASVLCGLAAGEEMLVASRVLQGVGGGLLYPQILAIAQATFPPAERAKAMAFVGGVAGFAVVSGPVAGGLLVSADLAGTGWRPIFLVNLPIGLVTLLLAAKLIPETVPAGRFRLDLIGIPLLGAAVLVVLYPLVEGRVHNWPWWMFALLASAVPLLVAFVFWERRQDRVASTPLVPLGLFRQRGFAAGIPMVVVYMAGYSSVLFTLSITLQIGLGESAIATGMAILPFAVGSMLAALLAGRLTQRLGKRVMEAGCLLMCIGFGALALVVNHFGTAVHGVDLIAPMAVAGFGNGFVIVPLFHTILANVPPRQAGAAGGVMSTSQHMGSALGIGVVGTVFFTSYTGRINASVSVPESFLHALQLSLLANIGFLLTALLLTVLLPQHAIAAPVAPVAPVAPPLKPEPGLR